MRRNDPVSDRGYNVAKADSSKTIYVVQRLDDGRWRDALTTSDRATAEELTSCSATMAASIGSGRGRRNGAEGIISGRSSATAASIAEPAAVASPPVVRRIKQRRRSLPKSVRQSIRLTVAFQQYPQAPLSAATSAASRNLLAAESKSPHLDAATKLP